MVLKFSCVKIQITPSYLKYIYIFQFTIILTLQTLLLWVWNLPDSELLAFSKFIFVAFESINMPIENRLSLNLQTPMAFNISYF